MWRKDHNTSGVKREDIRSGSVQKGMRRGRRRHCYARYERR